MPAPLVLWTKGSKPCVNVVDLGEGQTPEAFPLTLLSLGKRNKLRVRFAQGNAAFHIV